jgi:trimethylamine--corrinoid protein Co-methyltransferase
VIRHPRTHLQQLDAEGCDALYRAALEILDRAGFAVQSEQACSLLAEHGVRVDGEKKLAWLPPEIVERHLALAPKTWTFAARNPAKSVEVGGNAMLVSPGYGSPSVADRTGRRRDATMADFEAFAALAGNADCIDITGGLLVEPLDVPAALRPMETTRALIEHSDKPFLGSVAGAEGAARSIELTDIALGGLRGRACVMGLVNINSPLCLDGRMAEALVAYASAGQPVLLTPGILMGVTAPVTPAGAAAQALAELLACVTLVQAVRPGAPVLVGTGGFGADLRTGGPGFGRPENAMGTMIGAQMARRIGLPFRCSAAVTGARSPDIRSGYERMMTAMAAWSAGAHLCLQGAGTLDCINSMSYEQFVIDVEIWSYLRRLAELPAVDAQSLAVDLISSRPQDYLGSEHTMEHMREMAMPLLASAKPYDEWLADGAPDAVEAAVALVARMRDAGAVTPLDPGARREMDRYLKRCRDRA